MHCTCGPPTAVGLHGVGPEGEGHLEQQATHPAHCQLIRARTTLTHMTYTQGKVVIISSFKIFPRKYHIKIPLLLYLDSPTASYRVSFPSLYWVSSCRFFFPTSYLEAFLPPPSWFPSLRFAGFSSLPLTGFPSLPPTGFPSFPLRGFLPSLIQGFLPSLLQGFLPSLRQGFLPSLRQGFLPYLIQGFLPSLIQGLIPFP